MRIFVAATLFGALFSAIAIAAPVAETDRIQADVRRTTFIVNDTDAALKLYRDVIGLRVVYDQMLEHGSEANGDYRKRRLVLMQANDDFVGALGLLQYFAPEKPQHAEKFDQPAIGETINVINVRNLEAIWPEVEKVLGVVVHDAPSIVEYPSGDGKIIRVMQSMIQDPNGYWIELNKIIDEELRPK